MIQCVGQIINNYSLLLKTMNKDTFCPLPFTHVCSQRNGDYMPCGQSKHYLGQNSHKHSIIEFWNNDFYRQLRKDLINGVKNSNCEICWKYEERNQQSRRQRYYEWLKDTDNIKQLVNEAIENDGVISKLPDEILLKLDNTCNLKCPTCNQYQSSQHEKEVNIMKKQNIQLSSWLEFVESEWTDRVGDKNDTLPVNILEHMQYLRELQIEGGEPFANKKILNLLDYLLENNLKDIKIVTTTNLSSFTNIILDKLSKLNDVNLWVSYDSLDPERFNFIRYPADYNHFTKNLEKLSKTNINYSYSYTLSCFNVKDCVETLKRFEQDNDRLHEVFFRSVLAPNYFSIRYINVEDKRQLHSELTEYLNTSKTTLLSRGILKQGILDAISLLERDEGDYSEIIRERTYMLDTYDKLRGTDYKKLFPYL